MNQDQWGVVDPLSEALQSFRMSGLFYCRSEFTAPWGLELPPMADCIMFHVVVSGGCMLGQLDGKVRALSAGDFALVMHGRGHLLQSAAGVPTEKLFDTSREAVSERYEILRLGGGGARSMILCGAVRFRHPGSERVLNVLPPLIVFNAGESQRLAWIAHTLEFLADEARELRPGGEAVIARLADILVIQLIRVWIDTTPAVATGWLGALRDRQIGHAMALIHRDPARRWTLDKLAEEVAMSRSSFSARFSQLVGEPAMRYVTRWRILAAQDLLQEERMPVGEIALLLGYESEATFSRAFRRIVGMAPGSWRAQGGGDAASRNPDVFAWLGER
jgi:AraC-like DNA-binding protein